MCKVNFLFFFVLTVRVIYSTSCIKMYCSVFGLKQNLMHPDKRFHCYIQRKIFPIKMNCSQRHLKCWPPMRVFTSQW